MSRLSKVISLNLSLCAPSPSFSWLSAELDSIYSMYLGKPKLDGVHHSGGLKNTEYWQSSGCASAHPAWYAAGICHCQWSLPCWLLCQNGRVPSSRAVSQEVTPHPVLWQGEDEFILVECHGVHHSPFHQPLSVTEHCPPTSQLLPQRDVMCKFDKFDFISSSRPQIKVLNKTGPITHTPLVTRLQVEYKH